MDKFYELASQKEREELRSKIVSPDFSSKDFQEGTDKLFEDPLINLQGAPQLHHE